MEAVGVAGRDQLGGGHHHEGIGAVQPVHGLAYRCFDGAALQPFPYDDVGDDLGIAGHVEDGACHLQLLPKLAGVGQRTVVGQRHQALAVVHHDWLGVLHRVDARGAVAHVAHGHVALAQIVHHIGGKYILHQPRVLVGAQPALFIDGDAGALLPAVLQRI